MGGNHRKPNPHGLINIAIVKKTSVILSFAKTFLDIAERQHLKKSFNFFKGAGVNLILAVQ